MTARQVFEGALIELSKVKAPSLLLDDFNYLFNKAINQYINKRYNNYDINQQSTDDMRVLKSTAILRPVVTDAYTNFMPDTNLGIYHSSIANLYGATYEVILPHDYLHMLNCVCVYKINKQIGCFNAGSYWQQAATRLDSDRWSQIINDYYNRPTPKRPYYFIHNVNLKSDQSAVSEGFSAECTNPYVYRSIKDEFGVNIPNTARYVGTDQMFGMSSSGSNNFEEYWTTSNGWKVIVKKGTDGSINEGDKVFIENEDVKASLSDLVYFDKETGESNIILHNIKPYLDDEDHNESDTYKNSKGKMYLKIKSKDGISSSFIFVNHITGEIYTLFDGKISDKDLIDPSKSYHLDAITLDYMESKNTFARSGVFKNASDSFAINLDYVEKPAGLRHSNQSEVRCEIRYGKDNSVFELVEVMVDYIKSPQHIRLTPEQMDLTEDTSQVMEFPDYVCQEIINELVLLIMENTADPRTASHQSVTNTIAQPTQQQAQAASSAQ